MDNIYDHQNAKILTITTYNNIKIFKKSKSNRDLELKQELVKKIRSRLYECSHLFVVLLYNERTDKLQTVRAHFAPSESSYFFFGKNHEIEDYARAGNRVKETVTVDEGLLDGLQHTMEPLLRFSGLTTTLKKGIIHLLKPFTICSKGDVLTPEQAKLLKLFQRPLAQFKIKVKLHWNKNNEKV
ncbi:unnamed protein product [Rotaria magnacalcarata]|uniref:Large ribosomal subunit protein uL10-like insertion domain-containing protein n=3 Tax=Rotaria magnacalcarata TaxID=392030 RepID=A0A816Y342_9BILA|nr:unnamed protein product [Rotaria magnacalcarata]CAF2116310.1 unnamed protein product [Rotaria magnacalcarata]CAF2153876.1 unnamed protein product [Rotaria magnacalcarata]CAF4125377.1 unnamed protein product [Rotaria magnacalcarata]CAF4263179.1 unnamed protein product [Rotaria magnacalcarata]